MELWARLKLVYIDPAYSGLFSSVARHYERYNQIPGFEDLEYTTRTGNVLVTLEAVKLAELPEMDWTVALDALIDQYTQNETIKHLDKFLDKLPVYDSKEIKEGLSGIVLSLDEKTYTTEGVFSMSDLLLFEPPEEINRNRYFLGLNNTFDSHIGGIARQEYMLIGGERGSGKSITGANIAINQYESNNVSAYFTIEMTGRETFQRFMAIHAGVSHDKIKKGTLTQDEVRKIIVARANMFQDAHDLVKQYDKDKDRYKFEEQLIRTKKLRDDAQMIIIDDRALTLNAIDMHLGKIKTKFGDKFTLAVVDYVNQIVVEGADKYDWKPQIAVSTKLKDLARKYDIVMVSPYQIDSSGEARFAKGILDSADFALVLKAGESSMTFDTTKIRGSGELKFTSGIDWSTLRISPVALDNPENKETIKKAGKKKKAEQETPQENIPWE